MSKQLEFIKENVLHQEFTNPNTRNKKQRVYMPKVNYDWLIKQAERVEELEKYVEKLQSNVYDTDQVLADVNKERQRYKQALEYAQSELEYAHVTGNMELRGELIKKSLKAIDEALKGESE